MSMKEIILRDAKMCAYAAGNVEHFKYLMKRLGYIKKRRVDGGTGTGISVLS